MTRRRFDPMHEYDREPEGDDYDPEEDAAPDDECQEADARIKQRKTEE